MIRPKSEITTINAGPFRIKRGLLISLYVGAPNKSTPKMPAAIIDARVIPGGK